MVKGLCIHGDVAITAKAFEAMEYAGRSTLGACYNILTSAAVAAGNRRCAWSMLHRVERQSDAIDRYARSFLLKVARRIRCFAEAAPILVHPNWGAVDIFSVSILLNTAFDACPQLRVVGRIKMMLDSSSHPAGNAWMQTHGLLSKVLFRYSVLAFRRVTVHAQR